MIKQADISNCGKYRYTLTRIWDETKPKVMFIMLNPSTADSLNDDPTIRRCINFSKSWGFGGMYICNVFSYRSTNPKELLTIDNPFGDQNLWYIRQLYDKVDTIICGWGNSHILNRILKNQSVYDLISFCKNKLYYLELSKDGTPKHPLYLKSNLVPIKLFNI